VERKETLVTKAHGKKTKISLAEKIRGVDRILAMFANLANDVVNCPRKRGRLP